MAAQTDRGVPLSTLSPKYLHTNSTSHTWPFSAIAELIDNAYDPDVNAQHFWIDKTVVSKQDCLSFMDDGNGLDYHTMHKMLSFGYSDKVALKGVQPIGIYGNGFKSGSMRLGKDAIVFSKSETTMCIGMLSQTYLQEIGAEQIRVPIVCFEQRGKNIKDEHKASLQDILRYSPFRTQSDLLTEINAIGRSWSSTKTGTRIIIWNLRRTSQGGLEIDFNFDRYDVRMPSDVYLEMSDISHIPESLYSLRAYCSILYLKPRMQLMIRGRKVKNQLIAKSLAHSRKDHYKPSFYNKRIPITFGYNTKSKDQYGIMMYHKNRLIKAYERVGCQLKADKKGVGVIGVIECNFLDPTHNKQSFEENDKYRKTMTSLGIKLEEYWKEIRFRRSKEDPSGIPIEDTIKKPDQNWAQCDDCSQWRKLPDGIDCTKLPDKWFCYLNPDPQFRSCQVEEEPEDSDDEHKPSYCKTYKQQEKEDKRLQERRKMQMCKHGWHWGEVQHLQPVKPQMQGKWSPKHAAAFSRFDEGEQVEEACFTKASSEKSIDEKGDQKPTPSEPPGTLEKLCPDPSTPIGTNAQRSNTEAEKDQKRRQQQLLEAQVKQQTEAILRQLHQTNKSAPCTPTTPKSSVNPHAIQGGSPLTPSSISQAACSPSTSNGLPVISNVCSLAAMLNGKRQQSHSPNSPNIPPKRRFKASEQVLSLDASPASSPSIPIVDNSDDETDDDIVIVEGASTPKPNNKDVDLVKVKTETEMECDVNLLLECSDDAAVDDARCNTPADEETATVSNITTQTETFKVKVKKEETIQGSTEQSKKNDEDPPACFSEDTDVCEKDMKEEQLSQLVHNKITADLDIRNDNKCPAAADEDVEDRASPSLLPPHFTEKQDVPNQMLLLRQERDSLKEQVQQLQSQLQELQSQLNKSHLNIKKEKEEIKKERDEPGWHNSPDYKTLFENAKTKINELIKDKEALLATVQVKPTAEQSEDKAIDEIALQVDHLMRELHECNKEKERLSTQLESTEVECAGLTFECESLKLDLTQIKESAAACVDSSAQTEVQETPSDPGPSSSNDAFQKLVALRQNIRRLLVNYVPFDMTQLNHEGDVIDEILQQVLQLNDNVLGNTASNDQGVS